MFEIKTGHPRVYTALVCVFSILSHTKVLYAARLIIYLQFFGKKLSNNSHNFICTVVARRATSYTYIAILLSLPIKTYIKNPIGQSPAHTRSINIANVRRRRRITSLSKIKVSNSISLIVSLYMYTQYVVTRFPICVRTILFKRARRDINYLLCK